MKQITVHVVLPLIFVSNTDTLMSLSKSKVSAKSVDILLNSVWFPRICFKKRFEIKFIVFKSNLLAALIL